MSNMRNQNEPRRGKDPYDALRSEISGDAPQPSKKTGGKDVYLSEVDAMEDIHSYSNPAERPSSPKKRMAKDGVGLRPRPVKKKRRSRTGVTIAMISGILVATLLLSTYLIFCANDILAMNRTEDSVSVTIPEKATTGEIIGILDDNSLIKNALFCKLFAKFRGYEDNYLSGVYTVNAKMGLEGLLRAFKDTPKAAETKSLTFPEGWTIDQIVDRLSSNSICSAKSLYDALEKSEFSSYDFVQAIPAAEGRYYKLEGYLFPDTYEFYVDSNPNDVINRFLENYQEKIKKVQVDKAKELGRTWDEIMVIASIIQKEAGDKSQMADISAVIYNRLNDKSGLYPLLQMDSTQAYYYNYIEKHLGTDAQKRLYQGAYDTYDARCTGLPKGPICNPSMEAIEAALNPKQDSPYFYFNHAKDGTMYLAKTYTEHEANLIKANSNDKG